MVPMDKRKDRKDGSELTARNTAYVDWRPFRHVVKKDSIMSEASITISNLNESTGTALERAKLLARSKGRLSDEIEAV